MKVSFFPGCSLEGTAREYGESIEAVCGALNITLEELPDWTCCGASSAHSTNEFLSLALPARNLAAAEKLGQELVTPCAACFSRFKASEEAIARKPKIDMGFALRGNITTTHMLSFLTRDDFAEGIRKQIKAPLTRLKVASYYGCLLVRPPNLTHAENFEDPQGLDQLISKLGAESVWWPYKTECCGGSLVLSKVDIVRRLNGRILDMVREAGADCIVTACPLCQSNLDTRQEEIGKEQGVEYNIPVFYFTELMGLAFGQAGVDKWLRRHFVDPRPLLKEKKLI